MKKTLTVYVSPLEMDSVAHRLVELPMEQGKLAALLLELNTGSPLYTEVSDFCGREYGRFDNWGSQLSSKRKTSIPWSRTVK